MMSHGSGSGECILDNRNRREEGGQIRPARTERAKEIYGESTELNLLCMGVVSTIAVLSSGALGCIWQLPWNTNIFIFIFR